MRNRPIVTASLAAGLLAGALPAAANPGVAAGREADLDRLLLTQRALESGRLEPAVRAAARLAGVETPSVAPSLSRLPEPVARLAAAVEQAGRLVEASIPEDASEEDLRGAAGERGPDESVLRARGIDRAGLFAAAALLAAAIDDSLPGLLRMARAALPARAAEGCDQLDQPNVCVGGGGANTYTQDKALLIDLNGDDLHANSAGGADRTGNGLPVSVTIDLGGNDRYETTTPTAGGANVAQGSAAGGVGILVDWIGNDTYSITTTKPTISARGQGLGALGVGILNDVAGNDSYSLRFDPSGLTGQRAQGMGFAAVGAGMLLDEGVGAETYLLEAEGEPAVNSGGEVVAGAALAQGLGYAELGGAAIAYDFGGTDTMTVRAVSDEVPADEPRPVIGASATAEGFGFSTLGAAAVVLSHSGNTTRVVSALSSAPVTRGAAVGGFALGSTGGYSALRDLGGNDTYVLDARTLGVARATVGDGCDCDGVVATAETREATTRGLGYGGGGTGILQDAGGDDRYEATAVTFTDAVARDERIEVPPGDPGGPSAFATGANADVNAMGFGALGATGTLNDAAGNDEYRAVSSADVSATAEAALDTLTETAAVIGARPTAWAQAVGSTGGYGELRDEGGADTYTAGATASATATPATDVAPGDPPRTSVQGSVEMQTINGAEHPVGGFAFLLDSDGGPADSYAAVPADPACLGVRGQGVWRDCGAGMGLGISR